MDTQSSTFKIRLGLFVASGIILFLIAVFLIGRQKNLFNPVFKISTTFYSVGGLQVGNNVRFSGIDIGTVTKITIINDSTVQVDMIIQKDVQPFIKIDCMVSIGSEGIIGDRVLIISQGSSDSPTIKGGGSLQSAKAVEIDAIMKSLQITSVNVEVIAAELAEMMVRINQGKGTLGMLIHDTVIAKNIKKTTENLLTTSNVLNKNITNTSVQLEEIVAKVNHGNGTLGRLINDTVLSETINQTIINLNKSSEGINQHIEALKSNILFRGYYKDEAKVEEKMLKDSLERENAIIIE